MSAETLRRAAAQMHETAEGNRCSCGDDACEENWYSNFLASVADWLEAIDYCDCSECGHAAAIARAYLGEQA